MVPDDWFIRKEDVPYLFLSANPWACSCELSYLHRYIGEYDNIYVQVGTVRSPKTESVVSRSGGGGVSSGGTAMGSTVFRGGAFHCL